jgi:hypothetical protein
MNFETACPTIEREATVPDIPSPLDASPGNIVTWLLGLFVAVIGVLWRMNESKNTTAIAALDERLKESDAKHDDCEKDRHELGKSLATVNERLKHLERNFVHEADK